MDELSSLVTDFGIVISFNFLQERNAFSSMVLTPFFKTIFSRDVAPAKVA